MTLIDRIALEVATALWLARSALAAGGGSDASAATDDRGGLVVHARIG